MSNIALGRNGRSHFETILLVTFGLLAVAVAMYALSSRQQALRSSPAGFDGLQAWLSSEQVSARSFTGGWPLAEETVGVLVVPLFDTDLRADRVVPTTKEELLFQSDEYDINLGALYRKIDRVTTLVVLPKWRTGMRLTSIGHPALLADRAKVQAVLQEMTQGDGRLVPPRAPFTEFEVRNGDSGPARLYAAQGFSSTNCRPFIGNAEAMVLAWCPARGERNSGFFLLSDPDLMNNHGLRLGNNAAIARDFLAQRAREKNVVIDYSVRDWLESENAGVQRDRTWADLLRFFSPPFSALWIAGTVLLALAIWRGAFRYGPLQGARDVRAASKAEAVAARARLMRLTDQDGALLAEYAKARVGSVAAELFGPAQAAHYAQEQNFLRYLQRRDAALSRDAKRVFDDFAALPERLPASEAIVHVDTLERLLERIKR